MKKLKWLEKYKKKKKKKKNVGREFGLVNSTIQRI